jgi:uncharacterized membrane protein
VSWVFCGFIASIPAIFIAKSELSAIERGESSPAGKGMAQAAFWIAIINTVCTCLGTIAYIIFFVVMAQQGGAFRTF